MHIRRVRQPGGTEVVWQVFKNSVWQTVPQSPIGAGGPIRDDWAPGNGEPLPIQPASFRDFMLFEQHVIDASRGLVQRFKPAAHAVTSLYESLARRPFPLFRPKKLWYQQPVYYFGNALTFVPSGSLLRPPPYSRALDYELEVGFVLKEPLLNATEREAEQAIGAFVVLNDLSARDVQYPEIGSGFGPQKCKHFMSSMSPVAVTAEEVLPHVHHLQGAVRINGQVVARPDTSTMRYSLGEALAHASKGEQLYPGELFGTGTLPGGSGMENGNWLKPGDTLQLSIDGIGQIDHEML